MKRKAITPAMKVACLLFRWFTPCSLCGKRIEPEDKVEWDHVHALVHGGAHHYNNLRPVHAQCHKVKSAKDVSANAKVKRLQNPKPSKHPLKSSGRKIPARPWPKRKG